MALTPIGDEALAVSTNIGFTAAEITRRVLVARVQHFSGGTVYYRGTGTASATAANGEHTLDIGDEIEVWGDAALRAVRFISKSGEAAAVLNVQFDGEGGAA